VSLGRLVNTLTLLLVGVVLSRALAVEQYGLYQQVWLVVGIAVPLFLFGLPVSMNYFLPPAGSGRNVVLARHVVVVCVSASLFSAAGLLVWLGHRWEWLTFAGGMAAYLPFAVVIAGGMIACGFWEPFMVIYGYHRALAGSMLLFSAFHLAAAVGGWFLGGSLWWLFACLTGSVAVRVLVSYGVLLERLRGTRLRAATGNLGEIVRYVWPVGIRDGIGVLAKFADKVIFLAFFTTAQYAVYINGAWEIPLVGIIADAMVAVLLPELRLAYHRGDLARMRELMHFAARRIGFLLFPAAAAAFTVAPDLLALGFGEDYRQSGDIFRILVLLVPFRVSIATLVLLAAGKTRVVLAGTAADLLLAVCCGLVLIPYIGMWGPAVALVFSTLCQVCYYLVKAAQVMNTSLAGVLPWGALGRLALLTAGTGFLASYFLRFDQALANVLAGGLSYLVLLLAAGYGLRLFDATERKLLAAVVAPGRRADAARE